MKITAERHHEIAVGHTVTGHESKCAHLHGHNYGFEFVVDCDALDKVGRVLDFSVIKELLCQWLEDNWDHKFMIYVDDPRCLALQAADPDGVIIMPFNPTAENMARHFLENVAPKQLEGTSAKLIAVRIHETSKCSVTASL